MASGVSSTTISAPVAASNARIFLPSFIVYWVICLVIGVPLAILSPFLKPQQIRRAIVFFCCSIIYALKTIAQIEIEFKGLENLPPAPYIIAAKHQSWGDGIAMVAKFGEVPFVIGAFVEQYPFTKAILKKAGAMVVDFERGHKRGRRISKNFINHVAEGRNILIFPEGRMVPIDKKASIKPGIYKFQAATNWPIVPISTNLGLYWAGQSIKKEKGKAIIFSVSELLLQLPYSFPQFTHKVSDVTGLCGELHRRNLSRLL